MAYVSLSDQTITKLADAIGKVVARELAAILDDAPEVVRVPEKLGVAALTKSHTTHSRG